MTTAAFLATPMQLRRPFCARNDSGSQRPSFRDTMQKTLSVDEVNYEG
jgi:hypothetical protein